MANEKIKALLKRARFNESTISMLLGILVVVVVASLIFNYFKGLRKEGAPAQTTATESTEATFKVENLPATYTVKEGDSLWQIAQTLYGSGYNWVDLAQENGLTNPNSIVVDQELRIPKVEPKAVKTAVQETISGDSYTVVKGDNLWKISLRAYGDGFQWTKIAETNSLVNPNLIHPGNVLKLPR